MLVLERCANCRKVKPCLGFAWVKGDGSEGTNYYCEECDSAIDDMCDNYVEWFQLALHILASGKGDKSQ